MFKIDFVDRHNYDNVLHSLNAASGLDNVKLSAERLASTNYFAREPRRLSFTCLADTWLSANIFSGNNEHERYISYFEVRLYNDDVLTFHGLIDTMFAKHNYKDDSVSFTCYDRLRLLSKYSDLTQLYALTDGYHSGWVLGYFTQAITYRVDLNMPAVYANYSALELDDIDQSILSLEWKSVISDLEYNGSVGVDAGFITINSHSVEFRLVMWTVQNDTTHQYAMLNARTWRFYNKLAWLEIESEQVDAETDEFPEADTAGLEASRQALVANYYVSTAWINNLQMIYQSGVYNFPAFTSDDYDLATAADEKSVTFTGQPVPNYLFPIGFYENGGSDTERLKVLKAALFLHNMTILSDVQGALHLVNKDDNSTPAIKEITCNEVIEFSRNRVNSPAVDTTPLDALLGDMTILKAEIKTYYETFLASQWEVKITIDNLANHDLVLFDRISFNGNTYRLVSVQKDYIKDEYIVKGWQI